MKHEAKLGLQTLGISAAAMLLGYLPTVWLSGSANLASLVAGIAVSLAGSWLGAIPVAVMRNRAAAFGLGNLVLAAMLVRFVVVLALASTIALSGKVDRTVFLVWVGISYLLLLTADTHYALKSSVAAQTRKEEN